VREPLIIREWAQCMRHLWLLAIALVLLAAGCSQARTTIAGTWKIDMASLNQRVSNGLKASNPDLFTKWQRDLESERFEFKADGTFQVTHPDAAESYKAGSLSGKWKLDGNEIKIKTDDLGTSVAQQLTVNPDKTRIRLKNILIGPDFTVDLIRA